MVWKLIQKVVNPLKLVTWALKAAGNGDFGPAVKKGYWFIAGHKSWLTAAGAAVFAGLVTLSQDPATCAQVQCDTILSVLEKWWPEILAAFTVSALDDAVRSEPPVQ